MTNEELANIASEKLICIMQDSMKAAALRMIAELSQAERAALGLPETVETVGLQGFAEAAAAILRARPTNVVRAFQ